MNNEPVAWIIESDEEFKNGKNYPTLDWYVKDILNLPIGTKLYTHPVKELTDEYCKAYWGKDNCFVDVFLPNSETEVIRFWNDQLNESYEPKTLTDEEIMAEWEESKDEVDFARAILRKAQEK